MFSLLPSKMLAIYTVLVGVVALACRAHADGDSGYNPSKHHLTGSFELGNLFVKRQAVGEDFSVQIGVMPESCRKPCMAFSDASARCSALDKGTQPASEAEIMTCACKPAFMKDMVKCMRCAPEAFQFSGNYNIKSAVSASLAECEVVGQKVEGIDLSEIPGKDNGATKAILESGKNAEQGKEGISKDGKGGSTEDPESTDVDNKEDKPGRGKEEEEAADGGAEAAFAIRGQYILAILVAGLASSIIF